MGNWPPDFAFLFSYTGVGLSLRSSPRRQGHHVFRPGTYLLTTAGHALTRPQLGTINGQFKNDFNTTLQRALDGTLTITATALDRLQ